jgi:hypothetical protein
MNPWGADMRFKIARGALKEVPLGCKAQIAGNSQRPSGTAPYVIPAFAGMTWFRENVCFWTDTS